MVDLPANWVSTRLGELFNFEYGKSLIKTSRVDVGIYPVFGSSGLVDMHNQYIVEGPSIIIGRKGAVGSVHYSDKNCWPIDTTYFIRENKKLNLKFSYYLFQKLNLAKLEASTAIPGLNRNLAYDEIIKLPPLNEQQRIVAKIEELFSELNQGIADLKTAQAQLKIYRQALLKHAFEGKLTAEWRAQNADKLESASALQQRIQYAREQRYQQQLAEWQANGKQGSKPKAPKPITPISKEELEELPELPEGWGWTRLIESCAEVVDCHNKTAPYQSSGIPLIRTPSIRNMRVNFDESIRYVSEETYNFWSKRCPPQSGDILFTREAPMGEAGIVPKGKTVCMGQRMMLLRPSKNLDASFLLFSTQSPLFKKISEKVAVGTGVKHLRVGDVEKLIFPICSLEEQKEIAKNLELSFLEIDQLDQTITTSLQQAEALRQSILKKAFSGELVPQDPNDEPAAALLARIQAEKGKRDVRRQ